MVILQFNKLIRNKWVWGVFAILISFFFAFDFLLTDLGDERRGEGAATAGTLGGASVKASVFESIAEDMRGIGRNRDWRESTDKVNRRAWETLAVLKVAAANGLTATDDEVREVIRTDRSFLKGGAFDFDLYRRLLAENSVTPERFEEFLKRRLTVRKVLDLLVTSADWVAPAEIDRAVADVTDMFTVKVAKFAFEKAESDKVTVDDAAVKAWYEKNVDSLALPERVKIAMVRYDAEDKALQARLSVSENELRDYYDANVEKFTSTDTNGVETVKAFEEVKGEIEPVLRRIAGVECLTTNLNRRVYSDLTPAARSRLIELARADGKSVVTSAYFTVSGGYREGFMKRAGAICPGAKEFESAVAELDSESEDLRYGIVASETAVWLIEKVETSAAHMPTFEESKAAVTPHALSAARDEAFRQQVESVRAGGAEAVLKCGNVSTNLTFAICDLKPDSIPDFQAVAQATRKLAKGAVSEFVRTGADSAILVVCEDRVGGDAAVAAGFRTRLRDELAMYRRQTLAEDWQKWNLEQLGFEANERSSVTAREAEAE